MEERDFFRAEAELDLGSPLWHSISGLTILANFFQCLRYNHKALISVGFPYSSFLSYLHSVPLSSNAVSHTGSSTKSASGRSCNVTSPAWD